MIVSAKDNMLLYSVMCLCAVAGVLLGGLCYIVVSKQCSKCN